MCQSTSQQHSSLMRKVHRKAESFQNRTVLEEMYRMSEKSYKNWEHLSWRYQRKPQTLLTAWLGWTNWSKEIQEAGHQLESTDLTGKEGAQNVTQKDNLQNPESTNEGDNYWENKFRVFVAYLFIVLFQSTENTLNMNIHECINGVGCLSRYVL